MKAGVATKDLVRRLFRLLGLDVRKIDRAAENRFVWLQGMDIRTVIDIGANTGEFMELMRAVLPAARIYSFEPLSGCYRDLAAKASGNDRVVTINIALGESDYEAEINRSEFSPSSSLLSMTSLHKAAFPFTRQHTSEKVLVRRLDGMVSKLLMEDNILVKIDTQGFEDRVIAGGHEVLARTKVLIVETSFQTLYNGQALFDTLYQKITGMGFVYFGSIGLIKNPTNGMTLQADSLFLRQ